MWTVVGNQQEIAHGYVGMGIDECPVKFFDIKGVDKIVAVDASDELPLCLVEGCVACSRETTVCLVGDLDARVA